MRGPHGLGKTTTAALAVLWFASTRELSGVDWRIATTAGAWRQLTRFVLPEVGKWAQSLDWDALACEPWSARTQLLGQNIKLSHGQAFAVASDNAVLIEGAHADSVLYIFDEAKSIFMPASPASRTGTRGTSPWRTPPRPSGCCRTMARQRAAREARCLPGAYDLDKNSIVLIGRSESRPLSC